MERKHPLANCEKCPLQNKPMAKGVGDPDSKIVVVSRSPGYYEALNGKAFAGPSGKVLNHLLELQGLSMSSVYATNVVLCEDDGSDPARLGIAQACCLPRCDADTARAEVVVACGAEAVRGLVGAGGVSMNRGFTHYLTHRISGKEQRIICTNNPAIVLRDDSSYPELVRDFRLAINPLPKPKLPQVVMIDDLEQAKQAVEEMDKAIQPGTLIAADIEARGTDGSKRAGLKHTAEVVCAGFSTRPERAVVFGEVPCSNGDFRTDYLSRLYERDDCSYLWWNGKYDIKVLRTLGIEAQVDEDGMLLSWACDERPGDPESGAGGHSLEWILKDYLGWPKYEPASVRQFKKDGILHTEGDRRALYQYNGLDTAGTLAVFELLKQQAINDNVWEKPYRSMLIRLSEAFTRVELEGNKFDSETAMDILEYEVWPLLEEFVDEARTISKLPALNLNSSKQMKELYYESWGLTHNLKRPKYEKLGKQSTDAAVREEILLGNYSLRQELVDTPHAKESIVRFTKVYDDFKTLDKQRGTYFEGLVLRCDANGRIYTDFKIHGTETGRPSSSNPNMQNVTRPKEGMPTIRRAFIPDPGCVFISVDLSQAELRAIAVLSGDTNLQSIYLDTNRSLHKETAREFYGDGYTYEQYVQSKNINFGVAYWQSAFTFAQMYHMPQEEAQAYIDWWFGRFPDVYKWTKEMEAQVLEKGEIQSPFGHKRRFYVIPADQSGRLHVIKQGINFKPQNIAASITLWALCNICDKIDWSVAQPRITVHDNIVINCREFAVKEVAALVKHEMEAAVSESIGWSFPFKADVSVGPNWADLEELEI